MSGAEELEELRRQLAEAHVENARLRGLLGLDNVARAAPVEAWTPELFPDGEAVRPEVDGRSTSEEKVALFRALFAGRTDVYAVRWESARTGKTGWSPAVAGGWRGGKKAAGEHLPLTDATIAAHLSGAVTLGLYPLMLGDSCHLLACDFDGATWALDALAYLDACRSVGVPAAIERSRSDEGAHVWMFFSAPVPASSARRLGAALLREAMSMRAELDLASYDRMFPAQDFVPRGSYGNLIALPLQGECRRRGTTVFLDPTTLEPWPDHWAFLSSMSRVTAKALDALVESMRPVDAGPERTRLRVPAGGNGGPPAPETIRAQAGAMFAIERIGLPPALLSALKHLAALHNPVFYEKERLRLSTHATPRFVRCYEEDLEWLRMPRALAARAADLAAEAGSTLVIESRCSNPDAVPLSFTGTLDAQQAAAVADLADQDLGVLVAPPGTGKTVMACALIARHGVPTLVVVDRKPLLDQWRARLRDLLELDRKQIGQLGSGAKPSGVVDLAMAQSLARRDDIATLTAGYGLVVVDECHHIPAVTFERAVKHMPVGRWIGLTATPYRRDGLEGIITMHCGPIRHQIDARDTPAATSLSLQLLVHETTFRPAATNELHIQDVFRGLVEEEERTGQIADDVAAALEAGRNCLVLTQWTEHLDRLHAVLADRGHPALVLRGGMGKKARAAVLESLSEPTPDGGVLLLATGSYLGEGFDCPALDTLFLAFPLAFKGRIVQYVGRVIRTHDGKSDVQVHDYVDAAVPVLARMHAKRLPAYASLGFPTPGGSKRSRTNRARPH